MKRTLPLLLALAALTAAGASAAAPPFPPPAAPSVIIHSASQEDAGAFPKTYTVTIGKTALSIPAWEEKGMPMVPLRQSAETLGYTVTRLAASGETILESREHRILLRDDSPTVFVRTKESAAGNRTIELPLPTAVRDDILYVPLDFFTYFSNYTSLVGQHISIIPAGRK